ncbi:TonB-dependent receptor [Novosphingobium sediminicola]|uniref:Outer membrane receptor protein involved in Fe transport n=1 Tax=Novosphingobium sediminicola TaxID=563162 RepID=A0A7W6G4L5_9SPHN|nr:TonB-dependent receptor [Novosphingobium sediminicola]MBB3953784.1 outer membrane receptor protein involved in Fe transport [Novosphingobium sediminicola]
MPAHAQVARFSIPAQPIASALVQLGRAAHVQIVAPERMIAGKNAPAIEGEMSLQQAFERLLSGSGLTFRQISPATYIITIDTRPIPAALRPPKPTPPQPQETRRRPSPVPLPPRVDDSAILVTGSRLITNGNTMPTPVTVVTSTELLASDPSSIIAGMYELPALLGSITSSSNISTGGLSAINLRGIGVTRALLMVDGKRAGPASGDNTVNPDVIPQILLKRVDVVTGGVSAIYGSDAVAGVVNFITDTHFRGVKAHLQRGLSQYGDDSKFDIGAAWGGDFAGDRGHIVAGIQWRDSEGISNRNRRPLLSEALWSEQGSVPGGGTPGTAGNPYQLVRGAVLGTASYGGLINSGPLAGLQFNSTGQLIPFAHGAATGTPGIEIGGDGAHFVNGSLSPAQDLQSGYGRAELALSPRLMLYASLSVSRFHQTYTGQNPFLNGLAVGYANPFLASIQPEYQGIIAAQPTGASMRIGKIATDLPNYHFGFDESYGQTALGAKGELGRMRWSVDYTRSDSRMTTTNYNNINTGRLLAALDAVDDGRGAAVCRAALLNPGAYGGCVPLNIFGTASASEAAVQYIEQATHATTRVGMDDLSATVKGTLGHSGAGPVELAVNGEWRRVHYRVGSDASGNEKVDCTGIAYNCFSGAAPYMGGANSVREPVSQIVAETAAELDLPLMASSRLGQVFGLNLAGRFTHYNTSGDALTWKISARWQVSRDLRLRMNRSRDIRAPSLADLFAPGTYYRKNFIDTHTNTSGFVTFITQGNPDLKPERADTWTLGAVYTPRFAPGLSVAVDYYNIAIGNAIAQVDGYQPSVSALCDASGGAASICSLILRPLPYADTSAANFPTQLLSEALNVARARAWGVDLELNYVASIRTMPVSLRFLANWQPHVIFDNGPGGWVDVGGAADGMPGLPPLPSVKLLASLSLEPWRGTSLRLRQRWRSALRQNGNPALHFVDVNVAPIGYTDITVSRQLSSNFNIFLNVKNLFDAAPPPFASSGGSAQMNYLGGFAQGDDIVGRYFTLGIRLRN